MLMRYTGFRTQSLIVVPVKNKETGAQFAVRSDAFSDFIGLFTRKSERGFSHSEQTSRQISSSIDRSNDSLYNTSNVVVSEIDETDETKAFHSHRVDSISTQYMFQYASNSTNPHRSGAHLLHANT